MTKYFKNVKARFTQKANNKLSLVWYDEE